MKKWLERFKKMESYLYSEETNKNQRTEQAQEVGNFTRQAQWADVIKVIELLERECVDYALIGGYGMVLQGLNRHTGDIDILVDISAENTNRWIRALSNLPDSAAKEMEGESNPFSKDPESGQLGVIRIFDEFVVDIMPIACGQTLNDLRSHLIDVYSNDLRIRTLDPEGFSKTKQGLRSKDQSDLIFINMLIERRKQTGTEKEENNSLIRP